MKSNERRRNSEKNLKSNSRADARERARTMNEKVHNPYVLVWVYMGRKAPYREKVLKILSKQRGGVASVAKLFTLSKYSNPTQFRTSVLQRLQQLGFIYYDRVDRKVKLTRLGWLVACHAAI